MRRLGWWMRGVSQLLAATGVLCLAAGPEAVRGKLEVVLLSACEAGATAMVAHDLATMTGALDATRVELQQALTRREALASRLRELENRRQAASLRAAQGHELLERITSLLDRLPESKDRVDVEREADWQQQRSWESSRELAQLEGAIVMLSDESAEAGRQIQATQSRIFVRESELALLQAANEAQQLRQELAGLGESPPYWEAQASSVTRLLQSLSPRFVSRSRNDPR